MKKVFKLGKKPPMKKWWYLCSVVSAEERIFRRELTKHNILNFSPMETVWIVKSRVKKKVERYIFSGYVFVHGDHIDHFLKKTDWRGLIGMFSNCDEFSRVHDDIIQELIRRQLNNEFDRTLHTHEEITIGDRVNIIEENTEIWKNKVGVVLSTSRKNAQIAVGTRVFKIALAKLQKLPL